MTSCIRRCAAHEACLICRRALFGSGRSTSSTATSDGVDGLLAHARSELAAWPALLPRTWGPTCNAASAIENGFRVLSFNLLADNKQGEEEWSAIPPGALDWELRRWRLIEELISSSPDILCMQEVDHYEDFFNPELGRAGYQGVFSGEPVPAADGVAVFFRTDRFRLLRTSVHDFAILVLLEDLHGSGRRLIVSSAHFKSGKTEDAEVERAAQVQMLLDSALSLPAVEHAIELAGNLDVPFVLGADLNAVPVVDMKIGEPLAYRAALGHKIGLRSAYVEVGEGGTLREPPYTTWKLRPKGEIKRTIDFIFYSGSLIVPTAVLALPAEEHVPPERIPTFAYPSDHFALGTEFRFVA